MQDNEHFKESFNTQMSLDDVIPEDKSGQCSEITGSITRSISHLLIVLIVTVFIGS